MRNNLYNLHVGWFEYLYLFMIVLYAGQSNGLDALVFAHGIDVIFIIPPLMTFILLMRNNVNFNKKQFITVLIILSSWFILQFIYRSGNINITLTLYHYYQLVLCFIIIQVFKDKLFYIYEDIVFKLAVFSLVLWGVSILAPNLMANLFRIVRNGTSISEGSIYAYTMMRIDLINGILIRNAGFAWEPGRYSCFLCLAIFCNFLITRYEIKKNKHLWVFIIALLTTQSTTGIFTLMVLMTLFLFNKRVKNRLIWLIILLPLSLYLYSLDFAGGKLGDSMMRVERAEGLDYINYNEGGYSLDRIESFIVEWRSFIHDPIMGYCESRHSYFEKNVGPGFYTNNGTMHILAKYGFWGLLYYFCISISSMRISRRFKDKVPISYLLLFVCMSMSYNYDQIVLIMAFSFWGLFMPQETKRPVLVKNQYLSNKLYEKS